MVGTGDLPPVVFTEAVCLGMAMGQCPNDNSFNVTGQLYRFVMLDTGLFLCQLNTVVNLPVFQGC